MLCWLHKIWHLRKKVNMKVSDFIADLKKEPRANTFSRTMKVIEENYHFIPTAFKNGAIENKAGENNGSCKIFAFAELQELDKDQTLACFGSYYFDDVLENPAGTGHSNIRNFMKTGWGGIQFRGTALEAK